MLWIIETEPKIAHDDSMSLSDDFEADCLNLAKNQRISEFLKSRSVSYKREEVLAAFSGQLAKGEPIYVMAHGGLSPSAKGGHLGGMDFTGFGKALADKFGANLAGHPVFLLVCDVGREIAKLGQAIAESCDGKFSLYVPTGLMYVNSSGVPLLLQGGNAQKANARLKRAEMLKMAVKGSLASGAGWVGVKVADGTAVAIGDAEVVKAVSGHFGG